MQEIFTALLRDENDVLLKGSAVYQDPNSARKPADLDIEIVTSQTIRMWSRDQIQEFCQKYFGSEIADANIYNGWDYKIKQPVFTVSIKDERGFDLSIYDRSLPPPDYLSWMTGREEKIFFDAQGLAKRVFPAGLVKHLNNLSERGLVIDPQRELVINPDAHSLILRLCFLETIGHITKEEILRASWVLKESPPELLLKELKYDFRDPPAIQKNKMQEKISTYIRSHGISEEIQTAFIANMTWMTSLHTRFDHNLTKFKPLVEVLESFVSKSNDLPSVTLGAKSIAALSVQSQEKLK